MVTRILELMRGHILVKIDEITVRIEGEAYLPGHGSPDFVLYKKSITVVDGSLSVPLEDSMRHRILTLVVGCLEEQGMIAEVE